jgi:hypothetical protein
MELSLMELIQMELYKMEVHVMELFQMGVIESCKQLIGWDESDYDKEDYELDLSDNEAESRP